MVARKRGHLYRNGAKGPMEREFEERYEGEGLSKARADRIYGATVGKVRAAQAANAGHDVVEQVKAHESFSARGTPFRVPAHKARVGPKWFAHVHAHGHAHHGGQCDGSCRAGIRTHRHRMGRSGSTRG